MSRVLVFEGGARAPPEGVWGRSPQGKGRKATPRFTAAKPPDPGPKGPGPRGVGALGPHFSRVADIATVSCPNHKGPKNEPTNEVTTTEEKHAQDQTYFQR